MTSSIPHLPEHTGGGPSLGAQLIAPLRPKKVLFFGKTKARTRCTGALVEALRDQGLEVKWLNCSFLKRYFTRPGMRAIVRRICRNFDPDMVFVFYHDLPKELMAELSEEIPTVVWMEEQALTDRKHLDYVEHVRLLCLSTPRLVREYRGHGIRNSTFMYSGFSPRFHRPSPVCADDQADRDVAFVGGPGHMGDRPEFLAWLSRHHDVEIFGRVEPWLPFLRKHPSLRFARELRPDDYGEVCARSKIVLGLNQDHDSAYYFSNRLFLTLGCRGFHLIRYVRGTEEEFEDGKHLAWFHDRDDCLAQIDHYLSRPEERREIAQAGYQLAIDKHRYDHRVADILAILAGEQDLACPEPLRDHVIEPPRLRSEAESPEAARPTPLRYLNGKRQA